MNIFHTYDTNNKLTHLTYYYVNNEKYTVPVCDHDVPDDVITLLETMHRENSNLARNERRRPQNIPFYDCHYIETNAPHLDDAIIRFETHKHFQEALDMLPSDQRDLIRATCFLKIPAIEIAKYLNVSPSTVSRRLNHAKNELKELLKLFDINAA